VLFRYRGGKVGEYMWAKEKERLERSKRRPWEQPDQGHFVGDLLALALAGMVCIGALLLLAAFASRLSLLLVTV